MPKLMACGPTAASIPASVSGRGSGTAWTGRVSTARGSTTVAAIEPPWKNAHREGRTRKGAWAGGARVARGQPDSARTRTRGIRWLPADRSVLEAWWILGAGRGVVKARGSARSDRQWQLLRLGLWRQLDRAAVGNLVALAKGGDLLADGLGHGLVHERGAVQAMVSGEELRPVTGQVLEEMLARAGLEIEQVAPHTGGPGVTGGADDRFELLRAVREAGQDGRHADVGVDAGLHQHAQGAQPLAWGRGAHLGLSPDIQIERGHREVHGHAGPPRAFPQQVDVADDQGATGHDAERRPRSDERGETPASQPVTSLGRLVRIGGRADGHHLALPARPGQLLSQDLGDVDLDPDRLPVAPVRGPVRAPLERAHIAEGALMLAAHIGVERPVKAHAGHPVQGRPAGFLPVLGQHRRIIPSLVT